MDQHAQFSPVGWAPGTGQIIVVLLITATCLAGAIARCRHSLWWLGILAAAKGVQVFRGSFVSSGEVVYV